MLELEEALKRMLARLPAPEQESVPPGRAHRRILAEQILAPMNIPPFDNSAMDGYAVRAADVQGASLEVPIGLRVRGRVPAGENFAGEVLPGTCVRLFTGSPLPRGADAVIMQEDTRVEPAAPETVLFLDGIKPWENVRLQGEDIKRGIPLGEKGALLTAGGVGLLAAMGISDIRVGRQPVVGLLATGSELVEAGEPLEPGKIYESNRPMLAALLEDLGIRAKIYPLVLDTMTDTQAALQRGLDECDVIITSGGVSVGEMDFVKSAWQELEGDLQFWKVAIKPGRPFVFGHCRGKFLFGLPGNPVSAFVTFLLLVRPALLHWQGAIDSALPVHTGILAEPLSNPGERRHFMRVIVDAAGKVRSAGAQASHILGSLSAANGLVDVPPKTTLQADAMVKVLRWE